MKNRIFVSLFFVFSTLSVNSIALADATLWNHVEQGREDEARAYILSGVRPVDVNYAPHGDSRTVLWLSAERRMWPLVDLIINTFSGANLDVDGGQLEDDTSILEKAARAERWLTVQHILQKFPNAKGKRWAVILAAQKGAWFLAEPFMRANPSIDHNTRSRTASAMWYALKAGKFELVSHMLMTGSLKSRVLRGANILEWRQLRGPALLRMPSPVLKQALLCTMLRYGVMEGELELQFADPTFLAIPAKIDTAVRTYLDPFVVAADRRPSMMHIRYEARMMIAIQWLHAEDPDLSLVPRSLLEEVLGAARQRLIEHKGESIRDGIARLATLSLFPLEQRNGDDLRAPASAENVRRTREVIKTTLNEHFDAAKHLSRTRVFKERAIGFIRGIRYLNINNIVVAVRAALNPEVELNKRPSGETDAPAPKKKKSHHNDDSGEAIRAALLDPSLPEADARAIVAATQTREQ